MPNNAWISRITNPISPIAGYIAAPLLVAAVAAIVWHIQDRIIAVDGKYSPPDSIAFLLPVIIVTFIGGRAPGIVSLILSSVSCAWFLMPPRDTLAIERPADIASLVFMIAFGGIMIGALDVIRWASRTQAQLSDELSAANLRSERIANAFQERLLPVIPPHFEGLQLDYYYKPALDESVVGGDFVDVFLNARDEIVVLMGDVSGKGLGAATQVNTFRSIVRFALHRAGTDDLHRAIEQVNEALVDQGLISGFATMFLGILDLRARRLSYVSCGHEPGFLLRADVQPDSAPTNAGARRIDELNATGPVIGAFPGLTYRKECRPLHEGDVLVLYTDGFSESGPSRKEMLGSNGVQRILGLTALDDSAADITERIIPHTKIHAGGHLSDDACLLVCKLIDS